MRNMLPLRARLANPEDLPRIRTDQERVLWDFFHKDKNPQIHDINIVATELNLQPYQVRVSAGNDIIRLEFFIAALNHWMVL